MPNLIPRLAGGVAVILVVSASRSVAISQIALGLLVLGAVVAFAWKRELPPRLGVEWPALAFFGWAAAMVPLSADPGDSLVLLKRFYLFTAMWAVAAAARDERRRTILALALVGGAVVFGAIGAVQFYAQDDRTLFHSRLVLVDNAMTTGALVMMPALVAISGALSRTIDRRARIALGVAALVLSMGLVLVMTRSAILGIAAGSLVILWRRAPRVALATGLGFAVLGVLLFTVGEQVLPGRLGQRFAPTEMIHHKNVQYRLEMWEAGARMVAERPITGFGDAKTAELSAPYYDPPMDRRYGHLHSNVVHIAAIWGIPGLIFYLVFVGQQLRAAWRRRHARPWADALRTAALASVVAFFVAGLTEWYVGDAESLLMAMIVYGLGAAPDHETDDDPSHEPTEGAA